MPAKARAEKKVRPTANDWSRLFPMGKDIGSRVKPADLEKVFGGIRKTQGNAYMKRVSYLPDNEDP